MSVQSVDLIREEQDKAKEAEVKRCLDSEMTFAKLQEWFGNDAGLVLTLCNYSYHSGYRAGHKKAHEEANEFMRRLGL